MKINNNLSFEQKVVETANVSLGNELVNELFYQARNNAIEVCCHSIVDYIQSINNKLSVEVSWHETSRQCYISIKLFDRKHEIYVPIKREFFDQINGNLMSKTLYKADSLVDGNYYKRIPRLVNELRMITETEEFLELLIESVNGCNYPFTYKTISSY